MCLDEEFYDQLQIEIGVLSFLRFELISCDKVTQYGLEVDEQCNRNETQSNYQYLNPYNKTYSFITLYNNEEFVADQYGDQSI